VSQMRSDEGMLRSDDFALALWLDPGGRPGPGTHEPSSGLVMRVLGALPTADFDAAEVSSTGKRENQAVPLRGGGHFA
jgi:hypothetical protein